MTRNLENFSCSTSDFKSSHTHTHTKQNKSKNTFKTMLQDKHYVLKEGY